jgi:hypothetical protein
MYVCMYVCMYVWASMYVCMSFDVCMYELRCMYVCMYTTTNQEKNRNQLTLNHYNIYSRNYNYSRCTA